MPGYVVIDVSEIDSIISLNCFTGNFDKALVLVFNAIRIHLLHNNREVIGSSLDPLGVWFKSDGVGVIFKHEERWILLLLIIHLIYVNFWHVVTIWINDRR